MRRQSSLLIALLPILAAGAAASPERRSPAPDALGELERAFTATVVQVSPSVVCLRGRRLAAAGSGDASGQRYRVAINGAGTIVSADGLILTNEHVVQDCVELRAILHDGRELPAVVVAADARCDLAVLRVPQQGLTPARFCDWSGVARGQWTLALGNPYGLAADGQASVAVGVVANLGRQIPGLGAEDDRFYYDMLQTTASIHPGHSGGPLFNLSGELVGVITAMHTHAPADEGAAFAIPLTPGRRRVIETLCAGQTPRYGYLGLSVRSLEADERGGGVRGVIVQQVEPGGPADAAGVQIGDRVVSADGQALGAPGQMAQLVGQAPVGSRVELALVRDGRALVLSVETALREAGRAAWLRDRSVTWRGLRAADLPAETAQPTRGVRVLEVADGSPAQRAGVRPGDIIVGVGAEDAADTATFLLRAYATRGRAMLRLADGRALEIES